MPLDFKDTYNLARATEQIKPSAHFLLDTFFGDKGQVNTSEFIVVESRKKGRKLAPFVTRGARGVNQQLEGSTIAVYKPPKMAPKVTITPDMIATRAFGESVISTRTPAERAERLQAETLADLKNMVANRKNKMAADILTTGKCVIEGYADDANKTQVLDTVDYGWNQNVQTEKAWTDASAPIYKSLYSMSLKIQEEAGIVPNVIVMGKNVYQYMLDNDEIRKYLDIPNRDNLTMFNFAPHFTHPQVQYNGFIPSLGATLYTYAETYQDDSGELAPFVPEDGLIFGTDKIGSQQYGAVTLLDGQEFRTYAMEEVPYQLADQQAQTLELAMFSRCLLVPDDVGSWCYMDVTKTA